MNIQEIFELLNNVGVDFDGWYGDQCVDWAQVANRFYKAPVLIGANAKDIWNTYPKDFYDRIASTPDNFPNEGDIVIWTGEVGHIAVAAKGANKNRFQSWDQNYPTGSRVHLQDHDYSNVLGWIRPKVQPTSISVPSNQPVITDQTKIPQIENLEVQAIHSELMDLRRDNNSLKQKTDNQFLTIQELQNASKTVSTTPTTLTSFTDSEIYKEAIRRVFNR